MKVFALALLTFVLVNNATGAQKQYNGYRVLKTSPLDNDQAWAVRELQASNNRLDFWKEAQVGASAEIMVHQDLLNGLNEFMALNNIKYTVMIEDVEELIQENKKHLDATLRSARANSPRYNMDWTSYHNHDDINEFLDELAATYDFVNVVSIGSSYEGRDMKVIEIGNGDANVWIEAGIHAREWISPAVATYLIRELVENHNNHPQYINMIKIRVLPVTNPDGYEYSRNSERLWRKTRSDHNSALGCRGVDSNRNYGYQFGGAGTSSDKCSDIYRGPAAFSEVENQNVRNYVLSLDPVPIYGLALHSAAEQWLYPFGYDFGQYPSNVNEMIDLGQDSVDALEQVNGISFTLMHSAELYPAAGDSNDWYVGTVGFRFSYTIELRDQGYGFLLPEDQIIPSGQEMWAAFQVGLDKVLEVIENP